MRAALRQVPHEPGVDGAEGELAPLGALATLIEGWLGYRQSEARLGGRFETLPIFAA